MGLNEMQMFHLSLEDIQILILKLELQPLTLEKSATIL
jgi:hypothetical protein